MTATAASGRPWLKIQRDTRYGVAEIPVRIEVPFDFPADKELLEAYAAAEIDLATQQWEKLGDGKGHHYQRMYQMPVRWSVSQMPTKAEVDRFNLMTKTELREGRAGAVNVQGAKPTIVLNATLTFVAPLIEVNNDEAAEFSASIAEKDGFTKDLPDEYRDYLETEAMGRISTGDTP